MEMVKMPRMLALGFAVLVADGRVEHFPTGLPKAGHALLGGVPVGAHLVGDRRLVNAALVRVLRVGGVHHFGGLTTVRAEAGHSLLGGKLVSTWENTEIVCF